MLHITCFTTFQATLDGQVITRFRSTKERALLAYLAVEQARTHQRSTLAGLLWPDEPEAKARHNLAQTLVNLRNAIGDRAATPPYLVISPQTIAFNPASAQQVDVTAFLCYLHEGTPAAQQKAIDLYTGPFLADFSVTDSDLLENWILTEREQLQQLALDAFSTLRVHYEQAGELQQAQQVVRRLLTLVPWQEEAHCQLMRLLALAGERTMALAQYDTLTQMLMDELGVSPAPETDALYDQILAGDLAPSPSHIVTPSPAAPFQALTPPAHFVGRQVELAALRNKLCAAGLQIHALVGMGGVGKTTLATQIAHAARADFSDGVLWGNPATSAPLDILAAWASAYGYDFSQMGDIASRAAAVRGILAEKRALIVVDNVETLREVEPLLPNSAGCAILLTTRDLDVATALNAETLLLGELAESEALDLLREILGDDRVAAEVEAAVELCTLCGELPLAVEIAAQRLRSRPRLKMAQMVTRLGDQQQRLGLEISDRAVRASFAVSWDGLDGELQRIFALQAVFAGRAFRADAIAYLAEGDAFDVEEQLYTLVALSLLREEGERYFRQHPLLADFAQEQLAQADWADVDVVYGRMVDSYLAFAEKNRETYDLLEPEWGNLIAAIETAHRLAEWAQVVAFTDLLSETWLTRSRYWDARRAYELAASSAKQLANAEILATNLMRWGEVCVEQNEYDAAHHYLTESLQHYLREEEEDGIGTAKYLLARIAVERNQFAEAEALLKECRFIYEHNRNQRGMAEVHYYQADIRYALNDLDAAQKLAEDALYYQEGVDDHRAMIPTLRLLAQIAVRNDLYDLANAYCTRAQNLSESLGNSEEIASTLYVQSFIYRSQQNFEQAAQAIRRSLPILQRLGLIRVEGMALYQLGVALKGIGSRQEAMDAIWQSINIFSKLHDDLGRAYALIVLGDLNHELAQIAPARQAWHDAQAIGEQYKHSWIQEQVTQRLESGMNASAI